AIIIYPSKIISLETGGMSDNVFADKGSYRRQFGRNVAKHFIRCYMTRRARCEATAEFEKPLNN
ncbi:MAG: hypothetical protein ACE5J3_10495, partial [Methanosarcinales archaeon]